ncbi:hypothetical protein J8273_5763 [Carpediemonas membranifera]|uniref:DUF5745 domain-containing protein n=1 Tax=Carpediemonas membranifera TaxID=201153 RepID=A0A8J6E955_9EUKA|nr:hypothetical protein J8273_5763 [Carpediemonas membranifera]|eukprot:KAG9392830.1 hypothetical protein J8273_5763 [Carpediemonas membranifera]
MDPLVKALNKLIDVAGIDYSVQAIDEVSESIFVVLTELLHGDTLPEIIRDVTTDADHLHNAAALIDFLGTDIFQTELSHLNPRRLVDRDYVTVYWLTEIMYELYRLVQAGSSEEVLPEFSTFFPDGPPRAVETSTANTAVESPVEVADESPMARAATSVDFTRRTPPSRGGVDFTVSPAVDQGARGKPTRSASSTPSRIQPRKARTAQSGTRARRVTNRIPTTGPRKPYTMPSVQDETRTDSVRDPVLTLPAGASARHANASMTKLRQEVVQMKRATALKQEQASKMVFRELYASALAMERDRLKEEGQLKRELVARQKTLRKEMEDAIDHQYSAQISLLKEEIAQMRDEQRQGRASVTRAMRTIQAESARRYRNEVDSLLGELRRLHEVEQNTARFQPDHLARYVMRTIREGTVGKGGPLM